MAAENQLTINARPTKAFFIDMLTRDIGLQDCILDLVDNSLHSLIREYGLDVMKVLEGTSMSRRLRNESICISFSEREFSITDTCAGIPVSEARDEVFMFGISRQEKKHPGLAVYGIGMKRAFFKIGRNILMKSTTKTEEFEVEIAVDEWKKKEDWEFEFKNPPRARNKTGQTGTRISISKLNKGVGERFRLDSFSNELVKKIASTYALFLKSGINIEVNGKAVRPSLPEIASSKGVTPARREARFEGVDAFIVAGLTLEKGPHGWYIFCNGRMVLEADRTTRTGWGDNFPLYHNKYNHFVGYVYFRSKDIDRLPWTTTKHSVEFESPVYQRALTEMRILGRPITNFLNKMYPGDIDAEGVAERELLEKAKSLPLDKIPKKETTFSARPSKRTGAQNVTIQYVKSRQEVERIRTKLRKPRMPAKKVGEYTFDYYLEKECD